MDDAFQVDGRFWAMKKSQLPNLCQGPFDYSVYVRQGPHPSPEWSHVKVWWTSRVSAEFVNLFKKTYGSISDLVPQDELISKGLKK